MPFYEFRCTNKECPNNKTPEEHFKGINSSPEIECSICKSKSVRIISKTRVNVLKKNDWDERKVGDYK